MKNSKTSYAVNKQEDEDAEAYMSYIENTMTDTKQEKPRQFIAGSKEGIAQKAPLNQIKNLNRFK